MIVKHANACGVALAATIEEAYDRALAADPLSAFGMVCVVNRDVTAPLADRIQQQFADVLHAPGYDDEALATLRKRSALRILCARERPACLPASATTSA